VLPDPTRTHAVGFILLLFRWLILFRASMYMRASSALPQEVHSDHVQGHSPSHSEASHLDRGTGGEAGHPRHQALCSFEGAEILRARLSYGRRPDSISSAKVLQWVVDGKQPSGKIKVLVYILYDSAVQKLLDEVGLSLLDAANKSEWHNIL
jgi:hypothetical protein